MIDRTKFVRAALVGASLFASLPLPAQTLGERLTVHGYLSQGGAVSSKRAIVGVPTDGTQDYRSAALQVRYAVSEKDNFLIQFSHRRFGTSILTSGEPDVGLAWAFYQRRFANSYVKLGKVPMPRGIYNEVRMVGTVLPFYRAPFNTYTEGFESIDGAVLGHTLNLGAWGLEGHAYAGSFDWRQAVTSSTTGAQTLLKLRGDHMVGTQLWLNTPVRGVRLGARGAKFRLPGISFAGTGANRAQGEQMGGSLDATFDRVYARSEYGVFKVGDWTYTSYYGQAGVRLFKGLSFNAQADAADVDLPIRISPTATRQLSYSYAKDWAAGLNYAFSPNLIAKIEGHTANGYQFDTYLSPLGKRGETTYGLASIAVSF